MSSNPNYAPPLAPPFPAPHISPRSLWRLGGVLYLIIIVGGAFGEAFIRGRLVVAADAGATAANIVAHQSLWRVGVAAELFMLMCSVVLTMILYVLLRPVSRDLAFLAVLFNLVTIATEAINEQALLAALFPLGKAKYLMAFEPEQLHALSSLALRSYRHGFGVSLLFFGCECLVLGYLIFRSGYVPKAIGALMQLAGWCYLVNTFVLLISPTLAARIFPAILVPALVGEGALCLWLLTKGVDEGRWRSLASS
jgi:hypothetical protein